MSIELWTWCPYCYDRYNHKYDEPDWICTNCKKPNPLERRKNFMTLEEFIIEVRKITTHGSDKYWEWKFGSLEKKSRANILKEIPYMVPMAIAQDKIKEG